MANKIPTYSKYLFIYNITQFVIHFGLEQLKLYRFNNNIIIYRMFFFHKCLIEKHECKDGISYLII